MIVVELMVDHFGENQILQSMLCLDTDGCRTGDAVVVLSVLNFLIDKIEWWSQRCIGDVV